MTPLSQTQDWSTSPAFESDLGKIFEGYAAYHALTGRPNDLSREGSRALLRHLSRPGPSWLTEMAARQLGAAQSVVGSLERAGLGMWIPLQQQGEHHE